MTPEAAVGGPIALVRDGDMVTIDAQTNTISMDVSESEIEERRKAWKKPSLTVTRGVLAKYAKLVGDASHGMLSARFVFALPDTDRCLGAMTDLF